MAGPKGAEEARDAILHIMQDGKERKTGDIFGMLYPNLTATKDGKNTPEYSMISQQARVLTKNGLLRKIRPDQTISPFIIATAKTPANGVKPVPKVHDIPKRTYNKKAQPSTDGNSALRAYLVKEIRQKLDELEALG